MVKRILNVIAHKNAGYAAAFLVFLFFGIMVGFSFNWSLQQREEEQPYIEVKLSGNDFKVGEEPVIDYAVIRHRDVFGIWEAEIQKIDENGKWKRFCGGKGLADYLVNENPPEKRWKASVFLGSKCNYPAGKFRPVVIHRVGPIEGGAVRMIYTPGPVFRGR